MSPTKVQFRGLGFRVVEPRVSDQLLLGSIVLDVKISAEK